MAQPVKMSNSSSSPGSQSQSSRNESSPKSVKTPKTLLKHETSISNSFVEYQRTNELVPTTDVRFICSDGIEYAHACFLKSISPFFNKIFMTQGIDYPFENRTIIIPDYSVKDIKDFLQILYTGWVNVSKSDIENVKGLLKMFEVSLANLKVENNLADTKEEDQSFISPETKAKKRKVETEIPSPSPKKPVIKKTVDTTPKKTFVSPDSEKKSIEMLKKESPGTPTSLKTDLSGMEEDTDPSDEEIDETICKDRPKYFKEARRCQRCKKTYDTPSEATDCLTAHERLRCYYCFKVTRNTQRLFIHYSKRHRKAGRDQFILCAFCDQIIPYRNVSCHVISTHLAEDPHALPNNGKKSRSGKIPYAISTVKESVVPKMTPEKVSDQGQSGKINTNRKGSDAKEKDWDGDHVLKLRDLKQTIQFKNILGKTRVFEINLNRKLTNANITSEDEEEDEEFKK